MNYDESLENDRELLEGLKPSVYKTVYCVVQSFGKEPLNSLELTFSSEFEKEAEEALENDTLTAALCEDTETNFFTLCKISEEFLNKRNINACSKYLEPIITNKIN